MNKKTFTGLAALAGTIFFLSSCDVGNIEPPDLTLDNNYEDDFNHNKGNPASWGAGEPILADGSVPSEPEHKPVKINENTPASWGSGEPIMADGSVPGEPAHKPFKNDENTPASWGSGEPILNDGSVPGPSEKDKERFRAAVNDAGNIYKPKAGESTREIYYYGAGESSSGEYVPKAPALREKTPETEKSECGG